MISVEKFQCLDELEHLRDSWKELRGTSEFKTLSIDQYVNAISIDDEALSPLVIVVRNHDLVIAIIPFAVFDRPKKFVVGELRLFSITHRVLHISDAMLGSLDFEQAQTVIEDIAQSGYYDSVNLYEVPTGNNIYKAIQAIQPRLKISSTLRDVFPHWVIDFPGSLDAYLASFKSKTRNTLKRKMKQFQSSHQVTFEKITDCQEISRFLEIGEPISRQTYQWNLGTRLINDEPTRRKLDLSARQNELYCYLLYADGVAIAFTWGHLINNIFHYETPGFLREYSRWSPGTIMLVKIIEDLLETTDCRCFDFGMGGDFTGYKAQFGNRHYDAAIVEFYPCKTFKSWMLYLLDRLFWWVKRVLRRLISPELKSRVKNGLRKIGILK